MFRCCRKLVGWSVIGLLVVGGVGLLTFGTGFGSYMRSSLGIMKSSVKDSIPIEFEIQRARDLLEDLIPETRANLRLVAAEEVEVANLEREIDRERESVEKERAKLHRLRGKLKTEEVTYRLGGRTYDRAELVTILSTQFDRLTTAEKFLAGKQELLENRKASLRAAMKNLERTRLARVEVASKIEALEEQFRLMKLKSSGNSFQIDNSKLAQVEKVLSELQKRLDVAQKVMASEAQFIELVPLEVPEIVDEESVVERVDAYLLRDARLEVAPSSETAVVVTREATY